MGACLKGREHFIHNGNFRRIGIEVYEGYGLTETSPVASFNSGWNRDLKSVGKLLPGFEGKVDPETGEVV